MEGSRPAGPGLWLQALQVLRQGVLLDVFLDVPAREMGPQVLLHYEVQSGLAGGAERKAVSARSPHPCHRASRAAPRPRGRELAAAADALSAWSATEGGRCCRHPPLPVGATEAESFGMLPEATRH